jgi:single-stranded DNA-binding protein
MMGALLTGELSTEPVERTAANGKPYWTATVRVPTGTDALFVGVSTFNATAGERMMKLHKGSALAAVGTMEPTEWARKDGEPRKGWRLTASEVLTVYEATKRRKPGAGSEGAE